MSEHCLFCGQLVYADLDRECQRCGAVRETVDEKRVRTKCPRCRDVRLAPFALGPVALQACGRCKGSFLPASEWDILLDAFANEPLPELAIPNEATNEGRDPYRTSQVIEEEHARPNLDDVVACPTCAKPMERIDFGRMSGVIVDVCRLHGIWLDGGELVRVVETNRERVEPPSTIALFAEDRPQRTSRSDPSASVLPPIDPAAVRALAEALEESHRDAPRFIARPSAEHRPMTTRAGATTKTILRRLSAIVQNLAQRIRDA